MVRHGMGRILILVAVTAAVTALPQARPFEPPVIDGTITGDGTDWDPYDLAVDDPLGDTNWGPNEIDDLWVTYDAENLYIGVRYQVSNNAMLVIMDAGTGTGASNIDTLDWYPRAFDFPDTLRAGYLIANWDGSPLSVRRISNTRETTDITSQCQTYNGKKENFFYEGEVKIPWNSIYQLGAGRVPPGARVKLVALIAGGDHYNGPDSAPDNPGMTGGGGLTTLGNLYTVRIERNGDGIPDPYRGAIEGTVTYEDTGDDQTIATIQVFREDTDEQIELVQTPPGGGAYRIDHLLNGSYRLEVSASKYARYRETALVISSQETLRGVDFHLVRAGTITGSVTFGEGPGGEITVAAYDTASGLVAGDGSQVVAQSEPFELLVPDGTYFVTAQSPGYVPDTVLAVVEGSDSVHVDTLRLYTVRGTKLVLIDDSGTVTESIRTTVSIPDSNIFFYAAAILEARDDSERRDLFDLDGTFNDVRFWTTKLNNSTAPRGNVRFFSTDTVPAATFPLSGGRGGFLVRNDEIEVVRIFMKTASGDTLGRFKAGFRSPEPEYIRLEKLSDTLIADNVDEAVVSAQLLDISYNPVRIPGIEIKFSVDPSSTGRGTFKIPSMETSADGAATTSVTATGSGILHVAATASYGNRDLVAIGEGGNGYVAITVVPGAEAAIRISSGFDIVALGANVAIAAQLIDQFGNPVPRSGFSLVLSAQPPGAGRFSTANVYLDSSGHASTIFEAGDARTAVAIDGTATPPVPVEGISLLIDKSFISPPVVCSDPPAPEPDPAHNSLAGMDLTGVTVGVTPDNLLIRIDFNPTWECTHIGIIMETNGDAGGAPQDPFGFNIFYAHQLKPDYALIYKIDCSDGSYADFRRWDGTQWQWWNEDDGNYSGTWSEGVKVHERWITRDGASVEYAIPFDIFEGNLPEFLRTQVYLMQQITVDDVEVKRNAFDSCPHDSTLDLDFDPNNPDADWSVTLDPVYLHYYSPPCAIRDLFPDPPQLSSPESSPPRIMAGELVTFSVHAADRGDGIGDVLIDLSPIGGPTYQRMRDDGSNGDVTPNDGKYSYRYVVSPEFSSGDFDLRITARDGQNISRREAKVSVHIEGGVNVIRSFPDEQNDDHGSNMFGKQGLYYLYPTNSVFVKRAFDLEEVTIFETSKIVAGEVVPSLAFQVRMGNFPNPADEGTADWSPLYADINIQQIDIYIDAIKGGATEGLPGRQNDFAKWDAWDYAIVMEGWYKAVIPSNNQNTPTAWAATARKTDRDIILLSDFVQNTITAVVSKEALGNPAKADIQRWDIVVSMNGHDGDSNDNNFGSIRWVNESTSEWQFGGGQNTDRDPNIIDLAFSAGLGKRPGRGQGELLDYKSREAVRRIKKGQTAVVLEATQFEDLGPPVITTRDIVDETIPFTALTNAPLYFEAEIVDDDDVSHATFKWRPDSARGGTWTGEVEMGYAGNDIWNVDLPVDEIVRLVPEAALDSTRNIEFVIEAGDPSGKATTTPLYTIEIPPPVRSYTVTDIDPTGGVEIRYPEGTNMYLPPDAVPDGAGGLQLVVSLTPGYAIDFSLPPRPASPINIIRTIAVAGAYGTEQAVPIDRFDETVTLSLHYPQYSIPVAMDENRLAVYEYIGNTDTWILLGGNVNPYGNFVTTNILRPGTYGIFYNPDLNYDTGEVFSGIIFSPNPFSPNGDGLYEETTISFFLSKEATVTVEIYNIDGDRVRILEERISFTAEDRRDNVPRRIAGLVWDGRDNTGLIVPYGIYVARFTVTFSQAGGTRTIRENAAVAVIK